MKIKKILIILGILSISVLATWIFFSFRENSLVVYENNSVMENPEKIDSQKSGEDKSSPKVPLEITPDKIDDNPTEPSEQKAIEDSPKKLLEDEIKNQEKTKNSLDIKNNLVSWGFTSSKERKIDTIILHSSYNILGGDEYDLDKIILEYKQYGVAPHYIIDREGNVFRLVKDNNIAYHAGESQVSDGRTGVNNFSIGIELINSEKDKFTSNQYNAVNKLILNLKDKYKIKYILGHDQIAPGRKTDPWNINWSKIDK